MTTNEIRLTMLGFDDDGKIYKVDTIEHEGEWWLVPMWLTDTKKGQRQPERLIALRNFRHQEMSFAGCHWLLNEPMQRFLFEHPDPMSKSSKHSVLLSPEVWFPPENKRLDLN